MSSWEALLLAVAALAALLNFARPRALLWIAAGIVNYILTSAYYSTGLPLHPFIAAVADATICLLIYRYGREEWELPLFTVFQGSVLVSFGKLVGLFDAFAYSLLLELVNWAALFIVIGTGLMGLVGATMDGLDSGDRRPRTLRRAVALVFTPTRIDPWWWAKALRRWAT